MLNFFSHNAIPLTYLQINPAVYGYLSLSCYSVLKLKIQHHVCTQL